MPESKQKIISDIENYIKKKENNFPKWYVGITKNVEQRLKEHKVIASDLYIHAESENEDSAREIEKYFTEGRAPMYKTKGAPGGGSKDERTVFVYAYKTTKYTEE